MSLFLLLPKSRLVCGKAAEILWHILNPVFLLDEYAQGAFVLLPNGGEYARSQEL